MFGKWFASTYTGSMLGAGPNVFAVWGYVIAHAQKGAVELNPVLVAAVIGKLTPDEVREAIDYLCAPDEESRSKDESGRRLIREGAYLYRVVNHDTYRKMRDEGARREYNRIKKRESRARHAETSSPVNDVKPGQTKSVESAHTDHREQITETEPEGGVDAQARDPQPPRLEEPAVIRLRREMQTALSMLTLLGDRPLDYAVERCLEGRLDPGAGTLEPDDARRCVDAYQRDTGKHHCRIVDLFSRVAWPETQRRYLGRDIKPKDEQDSRYGHAKVTGDEVYSGGAVDL